MRQEARQGGIPALGDSSQMINEVAVQESAEFGDLRAGWGLARDSVPFLLVSACAMLRAGVQLALLQVRFSPSSDSRRSSKANRACGPGPCAPR